MANQAVAAKVADVVGETDGPDVEIKPGRRRLTGKKIVLFIVAPILLVLLIGGGLYLSGLFGGEPAAEGGAATPEEALPSVFFDLPDMLVNLNASGKKSAFLKIKLSLELADEEAVNSVTALLPRLIDNFQVYLRELRAEDLRGSAGLYRLREELLLRANAAVKPIEVKDVLFKEMLVQ